MDARKEPALLLLNLKPETVRIDKTYPGFAEWAKNRDPQKKWCESETGYRIKRMSAHF